MQYVLAMDWRAQNQQLELLLGALGHTLDFGTWRLLVRQQELDERAVELMVRSVRCAVSEES